MSQNKAKNVVFSGFWRRFIAAQIDGFAISFFIFLPYLLFNYLWMLYTLQSRSINSLYISYSISNLLAFWSYYAAFLSSPLKATPGMMALGLKIYDAEGNKITFGRATGRFFAQILCVLTLGIGYFMIAWTKTKQGLHDRIAGTYVIDRYRSK